MTTLNQHLLAAGADGKTVVVVLDEAQQMSDEALEQIRILSTLETATRKLLQIVLAGQPELEEKLQRRELRQLDQRIGIRCYLEPLSRKDTYPLHRAPAARRRTPRRGALHPPAMARIFQLQRGRAPRHQPRVRPGPHGRLRRARARDHAGHGACGGAEPGGAERGAATTGPRSPAAHPSPARDGGGAHRARGPGRRGGRLAALGLDPARRCGWAPPTPRRRRRRPRPLPSRSPRWCR